MDHRRAPWAEAGRRLERRPERLLVALYMLCVLAFVATIPLPRVDGQLVGSDGVYYYAYLPSLVLDRDLDLANEYAALLPAETVARMERTATGRLPNAYAIGPALLWSPFFLVGHGVALILHAAGVAVSLDGTGRLHQAAALIGSLTWGFFGLVLIYCTGARLFGRAVSVATVVLIWLASNLIYYMVAEPSMSHATTLFAVALFIALWLGARPQPSPQQWAWLGLAGGLVVLVRLPDATWLVLPVADALFALQRSGLRAVGRQAAGVAIYAACAAAAFLPQMVAWQALYGSPFRSGYLYTGGAAFYWLRPKVLEVLFSPWHGLYTWHPIYLFATVGLVWLCRRDRRLALCLALGFALQACVIGAWRAWSQGDAFGGRMFISSLPGLALGLGALVAWAAKRGKAVAVGALGGALAAWNGLFLLQYRLGYIPMNAPLSLRQFTADKLWMLADLWRRAAGKLGR